MSPPRHEQADIRPAPRLASALKATLREGYGGGALRADVLAGLVVGIVALPLSMALAIASGVPPQHGLYTAIVAGAVIGLLGGTRTSVSGPTAAFVVVLSPIAARYGLSGLLISTLLAGALLCAMGLLRLGRLIQFIPYPVTTGFTAGIAVVIALLQLKDVFGLSLSHLPDHTIERLGALYGARATWRLPDLLVALGTLLVLLVWPQITRRVPAALVALTAAGVAAFALTHWAPQWTVDTIGSRFSTVVDGVVRPGIPQLPPVFVLPWTLPGPDGGPLVLSL